MPSTWAPWLGRMATFTVGRYLGQIHLTCPENQRLYQKPGRAPVRPKDLCTFCVRVHWIHIRTWQSCSQSWGPCPAVYHCSAIQCYLHQLGRRWFRVWSSSWPGWHPLCQPRGPPSNCRVFEHVQPRPSEDPGSSREWLCSCPCAQLHLGRGISCSLHMARSTAEAFNIVCYLDRNGKLDDVPQDNKQKAATTSLRDELYRQDFCWTDLSVGFEGPDEPDSLSHYNECPLRYKMFTSIWDRQRRFHGEAIFSMTWLIRCSCEASNMGSWQWASLTPLFMLIINTAEASRIQGVLVMAWKGESASWRLSLLPTLTHTR